MGGGTKSKGDLFGPVSKWEKKRANGCLDRKQN